jgi:GH15 family glucan-1,4-alpha-glucosidase
MMAWVALDRAVRTVKTFGLSGQADRWARLRDEIHAEVCAKAFDSEIGAFVQAYGSKQLDASVLQMALVGFLPATDSRVVGTVRAIEQRLVRDGFAFRYSPDGTEDTDGLPSGEGAFLACTLWLADNLALMGRRGEAWEYLQRVLAVRNDVGLLSEEYDTRARRLVGNFPQAFSHVYLVHTARHLGAAEEAAASAAHPSFRSFQDAP